MPKTKTSGEITLDSIPETSKYLKINKLEEEGKKMFDALLQFQASPHISRYVYFWSIDEIISPRRHIVHLSACNFNFASYV